MNLHWTTQAGYHLIHQYSCHGSSSLIPDRETLNPLGELINHHQDVPVPAGTRRERPQYIHVYSLHRHTRMEDAQRRTRAPVRLFALIASRATLNVHGTIARHAGPIKPRPQSIQCFISREMPTGRRGMFQGHDFLGQGLRYYQAIMRAPIVLLPPVEKNTMLIQSQLISVPPQTFGDFTGQRQLRWRGFFSVQPSKESTQVGVPFLQDP
jgi:hypothetical protein